MTSTSGDGEGPIRWGMLAVISPGIPDLEEPSSDTLVPRPVIWSSIEGTGPPNAE